MADVGLELDRSSPVPLYSQVATQIEAMIHSGALAPGERLENEVGLADRYGLSRPTVRRAIQELVGRGLLVRKRGVGTQVVRNEVRRPVKLTSLYDDLARQHQDPGTQVLTYEIVPAEPEVAERLGLESGCEVLHIERIRFAGGEPLAIMRNWLPAALAQLAGEQALARRGLYELLRGGGLHMRVASQRIGARSAVASEAALLGTGRAAPLLTMERVTYDDSGDAVEFGRHAYRADTYSFELTLVDQ